MTRDEAKQLLPIIQAYAEGKEIETKYEGEWSSDIGEDPCFLKAPEDYRIKPEPKYRPFNYHEVWDEMLKHQPFGWLSLKDVGSEENGPLYVCVKEVIDRRGTVMIGIKYSGYHEVYLEFESPYDMFNKYEFADGQPFGIKVEEDE